MECRLCKIIKLPKEFAPETVTVNCEHPMLFCLRCTVNAVKETSTCPHPGCNQPVKLSDKQIQWFQAILDDMFKEYDSGDPDAGAGQGIPHPLFASGILTITVLAGESMSVPYDPNMEVLQLKRKISDAMNHEVGNQKLLYNEKELIGFYSKEALQDLSPWRRKKMPSSDIQSPTCLGGGDYKYTYRIGFYSDYTVNRRKTKILDFGVKPNSTLCLVIILFSVPENFNHVVFDLFWGYPISGRDYLDASCLMFNGTSCQCRVDFREKGLVGAVYHSGDKMDDKSQIGHHTINVLLKDLPSNITHLFFTLSARSSPNISRYPNLSLKFYEASNTNKNLCKTTCQHARSSQAVVMCSVSRGHHGRWEIFESCKLSSGNARNYEPIINTIKSLISQGV